MWTGVLDKGINDQPMVLTFHFKANGNTLTGYSAGPIEQLWIPIRSGKIKGDKISFIVDTGYQGMKAVVPYRGVVKGD